MGTRQRHDAFVVLSLGAITSSSPAAVFPHRGGRVIVFGPCNVLDFAVRRDADVNNHGAAGEAMSKNTLPSNGKAGLERGSRERRYYAACVVQVARPTSRDARSTARPPSHMRHGGKRRQPDRRSLRRFFQIPDVISFDRPDSAVDSDEIKNYFWSLNSMLILCRQESAQNQPTESLIPSQNLEEILRFSFDSAFPRFWQILAFEINP
ncbi:hypothetical protein BJ912DRAFT_1069455 [Pholiota molesta]|nr:hypothetical protein BJ912DRAFT_1069455 [Pholiota molesta]